MQFNHLIVLLSPCELKVVSYLSDLSKQTREIVSCKRGISARVLGILKFKIHGYGLFKYHHLESTLPKTKLMYNKEMISKYIFIENLNYTICYDIRLLAISLRSECCHFVTRVPKPIKILKAPSVQARIQMKSGPRLFHL